MDKSREQSSKKDVAKIKNLK